MGKRIVLIILVATIVIASLLRLWQLGSVPPSPDWDEAALGYNAYSILQTGKDEYGKFLPVVLKSFGDYKPALYAYFAIPSVWVLGLNVLAVRLPSAIFGILTVLAVFFLAKELFRKNGLALLSSFLLAISPWHIQFSRVAFEANVGVALNIFGILFFLKAFKKPWFLILSALVLGLNLHVYQSEKVFVPLLIIILILSFKKEFLSIRKKYIYISLAIFGIILLPLINFLFTNNDAFSRAKAVNIFSNPSIIETSTLKVARDKENNDVLGLILDNRRVEFAKNIVGGYISHFDFNWLFVRGDIPRHHAPGMGLMHLIELPFLLAGIYILIFSDFNKRVKIFTLLWLLIVPIPAAVTNDVPHAVRTINFLPVLQILTAIGILAALARILSINYRILKLKVCYLALAIISIFGLLNFSYYLDQYFVQQNYFFSQDWQFGYQETVNESLKLQNKYEKVIVSNDKSMNQSYIFFLFYLRYPPQDYQKISKNNEATDKSFGKYIFRKIDWGKDSITKNVLYIVGSNEIPKEIQGIKTIYNLDRIPAIKMVGT
jgi:4-amino-4-deoxy-L-arabinose transferase-like glycosyltransferase